MAACSCCRCAAAALFTAAADEVKGHPPQQQQFDETRKEKKELLVRGRDVLMSQPAREPELSQTPPQGAPLLTSHHNKLDYFLKVSKMRLMCHLDLVTHFYFFLFIESLELEDAACRTCLRSKPQTFFPIFTLNNLKS